LPKFTVVGAIVIAGAVPVPLMGINCGLPATLSVSFSVALSATAVLGVNVTAMVVLAPAASVMGSVGTGIVKSAAFAPSMAREEMTRSAVPELVIVILDGLLLVPFNCVPKVTEVGVMLIAGAMPVPVIATVCGLPAALSVILSVAERVPTAAGVKVTPMEAFAPGAMVNGEAVVVANSATFAPVNVTDEITRSAVPGLVTVIV